MYVTCNRGFTGQFGSCTPCPLGTTSRVINAQECVPCPAGSTTASVGAVSLDDCSLCAADYCNHHGSCTVGDSGPACQCNAAWSGTRCSIPWPVVLVLSLLGASVLAGVGFLLRRRARQVETLEAQSELNQRLLKTHEQELDQFRAASLVDLADLHIVRKVDQGAFGDVFEGTYRELPVAVKTLRANLLEMDASLADEMEREIEFMRTLRHTNILFFFGAGKFEDGKAFLVRLCCETFHKDEHSRCSLDPGMQFLIGFVLMIYFVGHDCRTAKV